MADNPWLITVAKAAPPTPIWNTAMATTWSFLRKTNDLQPYMHIIMTQKETSLNLLAKFK